MSNAQLKVATGTAVTTKAVDPVASMIEKMKPQMALALPKHINAERMARIVLTEIRRVPKLANCGRDSLLGAVMTCSQLGLEPGNGLGHAYLLPFEKRAKVGGQWQTVGTDCQLIIGYRGMIDLARRSGQIVSLSARSVMQHDRFAFRYGLDETIEHVPADGDRGALTHVYAVAKLKDGGVQFEVMSRTEVEQVRAQSKSKDSGPWATHFEEMAKKTAIRRLFKYLPVSIEMQRAVTLDEQGEAGIAQDHNVIDMETDYGAGEPTPGNPATTAKTLDQFRAQVDAATSAETASLVLDEARDALTPAEWDELHKAFLMAWDA
jgi:recombination protein RecT